jgi:predicted dehydrogenase
MKGLVVGGGSIGKRHLQNLITLGVEQVGLCEIDPDLLWSLTGSLGLPGFPSLDRGLEWGPDFVVVATPTHLHAEQSLAVARAGIDFFVEKPVTHTPEYQWEVSESVNQQRLITLVACNMRFHPGPAKIKQLLSEHRLGKVLFARIYCGSHLPDWRPGSDYRQNYAASNQTGGGCILDCIHEIDLVHWYLGEVSDVCCMAGHLSSLEIETEDVAALICRHTSGALTEIHLDYVQRTYERGCRIVGELGSIAWDFKAGRVTLYDNEGSQERAFPQPSNWQLNEMYLEEMKHFLGCIQTRSQTVLPVSEAISVMQTAFAAKESAHKSRVISIAREVLA